MIDQENMNNVPTGYTPPTPQNVPLTPTTNPIPLTPSTPPAHQMMSNMVKAASTTAATTSGWLGNLIAIIILIVGGASLYLALTKSHSASNGTPVTEIPGFDLENNQNPSEGVNNSIAVGESNPKVIDDTPTTFEHQTFPFSCMDLLTEADFQKLSGITSPVVVEEETGLIMNTYRTMSCDYEQKSLNNPDMTVRYLDLNIYEEGSSGVSVEEKFQKEKEAQASYYEITYKKTIDWPEESGVGFKALRHMTGEAITAISSNQKYLIYLSSGNFGSTKDDKKEAAKIVDASLGKY